MLARGRRPCPKVTRFSEAAASISPDGRYAVHVKNVQGRPSLWTRQTVATSDVQIVPPADVQYTSVTFSRDGNYVYYVTRDGEWGTLFRIPVLGGTPQRIVHDIPEGPPVGADDFRSVVHGDKARVGRPGEQIGRRHFEALRTGESPAAYEVVTSVDDLVGLAL